MHTNIGSGIEMLSVVKLCSDPIVKVISTKKNIQKSFIDSAKVVNLDKEKAEQILDDSKVLSCGVLLESDILEFLNFPCNCPDPVTAVVKITTEPAKLPFVDYQVVLKSEKDWEIITAHSQFSRSPAKKNHLYKQTYNLLSFFAVLHEKEYVLYFTEQTNQLSNSHKLTADCIHIFQEGYIEFPLRPMKHLFVISSERWVSYTLSPGGLNYKSVDFELVTVKFPPRSVSKKCEIKIQVIPPNLEEHAECQDPNDDPDPDVDTEIVSVSPRLWVKHDDVLKFKKPIVVTLPLPPMSSTEKETDLCLVKWTEGGDVYISETSIRVKENFCEFEVDGFSG
ncbi:hypothetical protein CHS0354_002286 [Potamilus streckersoni]|uniref:Uncharacterized protein n=1 Tax=Potamilus streckersoni TaxID=2493646 RepID=A0AAE0S3V8_9BIVA|nr:hypothetical protein CHS0354_002286 [Potamilus streckersoni]